VTFAVAIGCGTLLLSLPWASAGAPLSALDALFTATSATCVTGLVVVDSGTDLSLFGQLVVLSLIQLGGLGIMTYSTLAIILMGKRIRLRDRVVVTSVLSADGGSDLHALMRAIIGMTIAFEAVGAVLIAWRWPTDSLSSALYAGVFHSISAFCNAGFGLLSDSLESLRGDLVVNIVIMALFVIGGLGFPVVLELAGFVRPKRRRRQMMSLHTKIVLLVTAGLFLVGTVSVFLLESKHALAGLPLDERITAAAFQALTPRTAGFNTLPTDHLLSSTLFIIILLMIVGGSPGSTAGGIKTTTLGVLLAYFYSRFRGDESVDAFRRTVPPVDLRRAVTIAGLAFMVLCLGLLLLLLAEGAVPPEELADLANHVEPAQNAPHTALFLELMFEATSAFSTVGLTTGVTSSLSAAGRLIIILLMFIGRIGPLTLAVALINRSVRASFRYPEEHILVG
jgi:trk system potassium uptake protein TrkH